MKRRLTEIAKDFGISFQEAQDIAFNNLEEDMLSGKGKNTWISEAGQMAMDSIVHIPVIYRGRVSRLCPNPLFVMVNIKELCKNVPVRIKFGTQKNMLLKFIYVQMDCINGEIKYKMVKPPKG
ncbi:hypothetical protein [Brevundimonas sp.]|mgnify:FL=1|jgi:hypothetical protein|uniref:hypothetical protein n=1 Tax=Brevundimonas sp. TaxID=1871086 RepID=UPI0025804662|nr:hypothetical protein [Brevundimonas sp.]|tara:strand:- start:1034 stop:1402 length:369 start_codon:yes stop_codon:yes gene_type:complete